MRPPPTFRTIEVPLKGWYYVGFDHRIEDPLSIFTAYHRGQLAVEEDYDSTALAALGQDHWQDKLQPTAMRRS